MEESTCQKLLNIDTISTAFKHEELTIKAKITSCFYSCYKSLFLQWAKIAYKRYPDDIIDFAANSAFSDGVLKFGEFASSGKLYKDKASIETILFSFCKNTLRGHLTNEDRFNGKNKKLENYLSIERQNSNEVYERESKERRYKILAMAMEQMTAEEKQIIQWRHIEGKSNDEIAGDLAIKVESATNKIYRCMVRLKKRVEEIEKIIR